ncbi:DUF4365 domain-containing protein [Streptosporangium sp. NPDC020145]|uniref:DUF4365 domain-containing protein n=1 Tax=Streptosporangium sp. NPDC020145 TaxID=3154694 RepID=UPI003420CF5F
MGSLDRSARKEWFSIAYVQALASAAGYAVEVSRVDQFGVDLEIRDRAMRIDVQMKCTEKLKSLDDDNFTFDLDVRTYNLLCGPDRILPGYLFVVEVPKDISRWITPTSEGILLRKFGYYADMTLLAPTKNKASKAVHFPKENRLTVESVEQIMLEARGGRWRK